MVCAWPPMLRLLCPGVFAALLASSVGGVRLDEGAVSSGGLTVDSWVSKASAPWPPNSAAGWAQRDKDLQTAATYLDSIGVQDYFHLGHIKDILGRLEDIRERVTSFGAARDARRRLQIRHIFQKLQKQGEMLKVLAAQWEADGEVDDGGDELPTERDNICSRISRDHVESGFLQLLRLFCKFLDSVRKAVNSGEDEEPMAYSVSGLFNTLITHPDYRQGHIGWEIDLVLGEERRWVAKHFAPRPGVTGNAMPPHEGTRYRRWALRAWETQFWANVEVDGAAVLLKVLKKAQNELVSFTEEDDLTLRTVRIRIERLEFCKLELAQFITPSNPAIRERIRDVLQGIKARMDTLRALAARKLEEGEVDITKELLPSERGNVCTQLEAFAPEEEVREDVRKLCETVDRLHLITNVGPEKARGHFEVVGRMIALRRRPGYSDSLLATELEYFLAAEWDVLAAQEAVVFA